MGGVEETNERGVRLISVSRSRTSTNDAHDKKDTHVLGLLGLLTDS